jgi:23S rRNA pseudouridine1911/1915/1917 synthase
VLSEQLPDLSRSRLQSLIRQGRVSLDGRVADKAGQPVRAGQAVELVIPPPIPSQLVPEPIPLNVVFENQDLLLVNKPAGMVVHPSPGHATGTLVHAALAHAPDLLGIGDQLRPGVVHRLDKGTSGLIVLAKHEAALRHLQRQFKSRQVQKVYLALVQGRPPSAGGRVQAPIGRHRTQRQRMAVVAAGRGREAETAFSTRESFAEFTLLEARPVTGRTHQVRLHLAHLGCPIAGDPLYGARRSRLALDRPFLHAWKLSFKLPGESQAREFEAELPPELEAVLRRLRKERT